jgi:hypothetical protein
MKTPLAASSAVFAFMNFAVERHEFVQISAPGFDFMNPLDKKTVQRRPYSATTAAKRLR